MYQALYRKYRSQTFDEMVGQPIISTSLKQAVSTQKISHAYLFSGPRGTGKTSAAKIFAKAMNCPNQKNGEPCNSCDICIDITKGNLEDVIEIDAASNNGVDEIRDIRDKSTYAPSRATFKVYIIDEVHMLSTGAFNALLKTLEEPTSNVVFILATTELHKIPATILSRVQRFEFKAIKLGDIQSHLASILEKEAITFEEDALALIARRAEGGMRDALSILDQALSLSSENKVTVSIAEEITGAVSLGALDDYVANIRQHQVDGALTNLGTLFDNGKSMSRFATELLVYLRDILVSQAGGEFSRQSSLFEENRQIDKESLFEMINIVTESLPEIKTGTHPKIYAEMMTVRLANFSKRQSAPRIHENIEAELAKLKAEVADLKNQLSKQTVNPVASSIKSTPNPATPMRVDKAKIIQIMHETVADSKQSREYLEALKGAWHEILDSISPQDRALLMGSEPVLANGENAILAFDAAFNAEQVMKRENLNTMFGNIMSSAAGFSPKIMAVSRKDFNAIRAEFSQQIKSHKEEDVEPQLPDEFSFLAEKVTYVEE